MTRLTSPSSVAHQLTSLERKGFLRRDPNRTRAVDVRGPENDADGERGEESTEAVRAERLRQQAARRRDRQGRDRECRGRIAVRSRPRARRDPRDRHHRPRQR